MIELAAVLLAGFALVGSAFFSGAETGLYCINRLRLQLGVQRREPQALHLSTFVNDEQSALSVTLLGTNTMNYLCTAAVAFLIGRLVSADELNTEIYTVALVTPIVFVFGEVTPKNLFQWNADVLMLRGSRLLVTVSAMFRATGVVWVLNTMTRLVTGLLGGDYEALVHAAPKRRFAALVREALATEAAGEEQSELVERVLQLSETPLHSVMMPRNRIISINANADRKTVVSLARRTNHRRLPVYAGDKRRVIGLVKIDDLLGREGWQTVTEGLRPISVLGAHDTVAAAILQMQRSRHPMGVVVDRAGRLLGLVTLKDLLEEVVGELGAW